MKLSISQKIILLFTFLIVLLVTVLGIYFIRQQEKILFIEFDEKAKILLSSLVTSSEYPVLIEDTESLKKIGESALKQNDVVFCEIKNDKGMVLFTGGKERLPDTRNYSSPVLIGTTPELFGEDLILGSQEKETKEIATINLSLTLSNITEKINGQKRILGLIIFVGIIAAIVFIAVLIQFVVSRPINELIKGAQKISGGDLDYKVPLATNDEIGLLSNSFNEMTRNLKEKTVSKDYVDNVISAMVEALIVLSPDWKIQMVNPATCDMLDYREEDLVGQSLDKLFHKDSALKNSGYRSSLHMLQEKGSVRNIEEIFETNNKETIPVVFSASVMRDKDNKIRSIVCLAQDISERQEMEENLRKLSRAVEQSPSSVIITDIKGHIEYVNPQFTHVTGYSPDEVLGKSPSFLKSGETSSVVYKQLWETIRSGQLWKGEFHNRKKNGEMYWALASISPIKNAQGEITHFLSLEEDITHRKQMEDTLQETNVSLRTNERALKNILHDLQDAHEQLKNTQGQLVQSEKLASIGQLAAGVAHEINNPVGFIGNNLEITGEFFLTVQELLSHLEVLIHNIREENCEGAQSMVEKIEKLFEEKNVAHFKTEVPELLNDAKEGIERVKKIVNDLRIFARGDSEQMGDVNVNDVIDDILNIAWNELKYNAEVVKEYGDIPFIKGHAQRLGQVVMNLLVNASQSFVDKGKITIKTYKQADYIFIKISDTGRGIPPESLEKIFDAFYTTKPVGHGTGLGLSISLEIVKKHGGDISVESKVNEGTTFTIQLPIKKESEDEGN